MAFTTEQTELAWAILNEINPIADNANIHKHNGDNPYKGDTIIGIEDPEGSGWVSIFINVRNLTDEEFALFNKRKIELGAKSYCKKRENNIWVMGWYL